MRGKVHWFNNQKGFGFITPDGHRPGEKEHFVHHQDIIMDGYRSLVDGEAVEFDADATEKGPRARNVRRA